MLMLSPSVQMGIENESKLSDFSIEKDLGKGAFGKVMKARHIATNRVFALKEINKKLIRDSQMETQIVNEIKIMYSLDHPNIIKLINHFEDDTNCYMVIEFAEGGQVYDNMISQPSKRLPERVVAKLIYQLSEALGYLHAKKIIHRDIKPENLLLSKEGDLKLADFGWSNFEEHSKKRETYCGTLDYLAPEMADRNHKHDHTVDIWSIGVLVFELLTGKAPFSPEQTPGVTLTKIERATKENIIKLKYTFPTDFPVLAKDLVKRILHLNPKHRYSTEQIMDHPWLKSYGLVSKKTRLDEKEEEFRNFINGKLKDSIVQLDNTDDAFTDEEITNYIRPESILSRNQFTTMDPNSATNSIQRNPFFSKPENANNSGVTDNPFKRRNNQTDSPGLAADLAGIVISQEKKIAELEKKISALGDISQLYTLLQAEKAHLNQRLQITSTKLATATTKVSTLQEENTSLKQRLGFTSERLELMLASAPEARLAASVETHITQLEHSNAHLSANLMILVDFGEKIKQKDETISILEKHCEELKLIIEEKRVDHKTPFNYSPTDNPLLEVISNAIRNPEQRSLIKDVLAKLEEEEKGQNV